MDAMFTKEELSKSLVMKSKKSSRPALPEDRMRKLIGMIIKVQHIQNVGKDIMHAFQLFEILYDTGSLLVLKSNWSVQHGFANGIHKFQLHPP